MYEFVLAYWRRGGKTDDLASFILDIGPVLTDQTSDPAQIQDWLKTAESIMSSQRAWSDVSPRDSE